MIVTVFRLTADFPQQGFLRSGVCLRMSCR